MAATPRPSPDEHAQHLQLIIQRFGWALFDGGELVGDLDDQLDALELKGIAQGALQHLDDANVLADLLRKML